MSGLGSRRKAKARPGLGSYPDGMVEHAELRWTISASRKTPSSCTPPTTARSSSLGRTAASHRSGARRTPTGKAAIGTMRRAPAGTIKPGTIYNEIVAHEDWIPTLVRRPLIRKSRGTAGWPYGRRQDLQGSPRPLQRHQLSGRGQARIRARSSSTSSTTGRSLHCACLCRAAVAWA